MGSSSKGHIVTINERHMNTVTQALCTRFPHPMTEELNRVIQAITQKPQPLETSFQSRRPHRARKKMTSRAKPSLHLLEEMQCTALPLPAKPLHQDEVVIDLTTSSISYKSKG